MHNKSVHYDAKGQQSALVDRFTESAHKMAPALDDCLFCDHCDRSMCVCVRGRGEALFNG